MSRGARIMLVALAASALAACFNPTFNDPMCGPSGECPSGTSCVQGVCRAGGGDIDASIDSPIQDIDAPSIDAPSIDAPSIDAPSIDAPSGAVCPNGVTEGAEECDDNNTTNTDDCTGICRFNVCGDTFLDLTGPRTDTCDDGNMSDTDNCVNTAGGCRPSSCGDGFIDSVAPGTEACDDRNVTSGDGCSATCLIEAGFMCTGTPSVCSPISPICGNGVIDGSEACDDRNGNACGTCNATCTAAITPRAATGSITSALGNNQIDGETFTLEDGFNPPVVFEWDRTSSFTAGRIPVVYFNNAGQGQMADAVTAAINGISVGLLITADHSMGGPTVTLLHDRMTSLGNRPISDSVSNAQFVTTGMSGGAAGDCGATIGCTSNADCAGTGPIPPRCVGTGTCE